jgi:hypothetical protein
MGEAIDALRISINFETGKRGIWNLRKKQKASHPSEFIVV